jgi:esterase
MTESIVYTAGDLAEQLELFRETHPVRQVRNSGLDWDYLSGGSGSQAIVLIPGGCGKPEDMFTLMSALEADFRVVTIGFPDDFHHVPDFTKAIAQIMDDQGIRGGCILGHSLGAMFAECFMIEYPERTDALILANMAHLTPFRETLARGCLTISNYLPRAWLNRQAATVIRGSLKDSQGEEFWAAILAHEIASLSSTTFANRVDAMLGVLDRYPTKRIDLDGWNRWVLILESDNDHAFTPAERDSLRALYPNAENHIFEGAGHFSPYTRPDEFAAVASSFLCQYL